MIRSYIRWLFLFGSLFCVMASGRAEVYTNNYHESDRIKVISKYNLNAYDKKISRIIVQLQSRQLNTMADRINFLTELFLNSPYLLGGLGEGKKAKFDRSPPYRTDKFDCLTLVSTVLALANADDLNAFKGHIKNIRYHGDSSQYQNRNHFMTVDWNYWNQKKGYMLDITDQIVDAHGVLYAKHAETYINKKRWYQKKHASNIKMFKRPSKAISEQLLIELHSLSEEVENISSRVDYIPISSFFDEQGKVKTAVLDQLPNGAIIEIVRPGWDLTKEIGTRLNISHVGFLIQTDRGLQYRAASSIAGRVLDIPLEKYLRYALKEPSIEGINIQQVKKFHN